MPPRHPREDTPFDLRRRQITLAKTVHEIVIPDEIAAALRELRLLDADCERLVFRIRTHHDGAILAASNDHLDELIGSAAAEANTNPTGAANSDSTPNALNTAAQTTGGW